MSILENKKKPIKTWKVEQFHLSKRFPLSLGSIKSNWRCLKVTHDQQIL